jgi:hypothetical protein
LQDVKTFCKAKKLITITAAGCLYKKGQTMKLITLTLALLLLPPPQPQTPVAKGKM